MKSGNKQLQMGADILTSVWNNKHYWNQNPVLDIM